MTHRDTTVAVFWSAWLDWWCSLSAEARALALENIEREQALTTPLGPTGAARIALLASFFQPHGG